MIEKAFIIGNGSSRAGFDLMNLKGRGTVFGCNALYRQYAPDYKLPDYLVAIDEAIITEIECSDFPSKRFIVPPEDEKWEPIDVHWGSSHRPGWNPQRPRSNAGMNAINEARKFGFKDLYLLGFDFLVLEGEQATSNMFDGSDCYGPETRASLQDSRNRMKFLGWIVEKYPEIRFNFVFPKETYIYQPSVDNCRRIDYEEILK